MSASPSLILSSPYLGVSASPSFVLTSSNKRKPLETENERLLRERPWVNSVWENQNRTPTKSTQNNSNYETVDFYTEKLSKLGLALPSDLLAMDKSFNFTIPSDATITSVIKDLVSSLRLDAITDTVCACCDLHHPKTSCETVSHTDEVITVSCFHYTSFNAVSNFLARCFPKDWPYLRMSSCLRVFSVAIL